MKKIKVYNFIIFAAGLLLLSLGVQLFIKADFGVSVATSPPYVLSLYFTNITLGQWNYMIQGLVLLVLVVIVRKLTVKYLMSFIVAFLFGTAIDLFNIVLSTVHAQTLIGRAGLFILGSIAVSIGVASFMSSSYPILPFDTFVKEVSLAKGIKFAKFKTAFDLSCFTISLILSMAFFREIRGIHIGTLVSAAFLGNMMGICIKYMNTWIEGKPIIPEAKVKQVLDYDFLNFK